MKETEKIRDNPILNEKQKLLLHKFKRWSEAGEFYMTGGTALAAFYLQHRLSDDLDFFSEDTVNGEVILSFLRTIPGIRDLHLERKFDRKIFLIHFGDGEDLKVEFTRYPFKRIHPFYIIEGIQIDSIMDILVNKLAALADRKDVKDYVDLYFILKEHPELTIEDLITKAEQKFGIRGLRYILEGRFLECAKQTGLLKMKKRYRSDEMVDFFKRMGRSLIKRSIKND
ncbi:MAG: nucleotidyl transferase AbiEii/AbiGii toxin family protein [Nitrospirota bacterium]